MLRELNRELGIEKSQTTGVQSSPSIPAQSSSSSAHREIPPLSTDKIQSPGAQSSISGLTFNGQPIQSISIAPPPLSNQGGGESTGWSGTLWRIAAALFLANVVFWLWPKVQKEEVQEGSGSRIHHDTHTTHHTTSSGLLTGPPTTELNDVFNKIITMHVSTDNLGHLKDIHHLGRGGEAPPTSPQSPVPLLAKGQKILVLDLLDLGVVSTLEKKRVLKTVLVGASEWVQEIETVRRGLTKNAKPVIVRYKMRIFQEKNKGDYRHQIESVEIECENGLVILCEFNENHKIISCKACIKVPKDSEGDQKN
jgi:hypothetical protein